MNDVEIIAKKPRNPLARNRVAITFAEQGKTHQSFAEECDIQNIVKTYARTGIVNHVPRTQPQYGENPDITFYEAACISAEATQAAEQGVGSDLPEKTAPEAPESVSEPVADTSDPKKAPEGASSATEEGGGT